ncbi:Transposase-like Mu [Oleidesulfovibrio alaskensis G20]|jgi:putative transposase|uniref:Transposase-like Mu n=2 Tax=Oleidesulfovibrio alaskensis TaxID=58180 RepID=Q30W02_OLEA2|nr:Mu transposase C-terminal domain-containing protein [Oleidesulfovibrio alaskensis]ABB40144.1 Transposase-like Mu [Oleidesulfovibrio alaskensis G20]MBL3580883.1 Mu transposase C-terminal domain-containing protein [Oleidesulfovibrio alaskensis]MBL3587984.1 Mu transposase C-terminal domain-containing protein [bacterium]
MAKAKDAYTAKELAIALNVTVMTITRRAEREGWQSRPRAGRGGGNEWIISSMPEATRTKLLAACAQDQLDALDRAPKLTLATAAVSESKKSKALARADLVALYTDWLDKSPHGAKSAARDKFILAYVGGAWPALLKVLGDKVSWKSIERWKVQIQREGSAAALVDRRGGANAERMAMTESHAELLLSAVLRPNHPSISGAIRMASAAMKARGLEVPAERTMRRFLDQWKATNFGTWVYTREGKKAWNDKAAFFIDRDYSLIEVGDILVADGHVLNFETLNPWTGKPQRMELVLWYDMASNCPVGWEIMPTENTQAIASAFRRAVLTLGKYPLIAYLDNGRAFRSKYFNGVDFRQTGIAGLFQELSVHTIFAWPYHGQSKTVERFFGTLHDLEQWVPSYVGRDIESKPPRLNRGELLHRKVWDASGCRALTMEETHVAVARWVDQYINRPQRGHLNGRCPAEVFMAGRGSGVDEAKLRHLMMAKEVRKLSREGIRIFGERYYAPELYSRTHAVQVRYDIGDLSSLLVYSEDGKHFICEAHKVRGIHPAADLLGTEQHSADLREALSLKKLQEREASSVARGVLEAALTDQRNRMRALQEEQVEPKAVSTGTLPQSKITSIEAAKRQAQTKRESAPTYIPPAQKPDIVNELDKYEYLFNVSVRDGLTLRESDQEWMESIERTEDFQRDAAHRYERLRKYYARNRANPATA